MDMLYYIYIGSNRVTIDHLSKITGGMFMAVSSCNKAAKVIDGIRERYNTSILYEESTPQKDSQNITFLHKRFPRVYIILITEGLQKEHRKLYLQAGVNNTLSPMASEESLLQMVKFLRLRKEHKLQEFSQSHRKIFNTFHLPVWKRIFDILFAVAVLIVLSPILIATAIAIRVESKGRVIYKSQRVGSNYQIFNFLKFRSMYTNADKRLKELNALNQYKIEEELTDEDVKTYYNNIQMLLKEKKYKEAVQYLQENFATGSMEYLKVALTAFDQLNALTEAELLDGGYTRQELYNDLEFITVQYGIHL